jgi:hypothetical protein
MQGVVHEPGRDDYTHKRIAVDAEVGGTSFFRHAAIRVQAEERPRPEKQENCDKMKVEYAIDPARLLPCGLRHHHLYLQ